MAHRIGVLLSGCGYLDGTEIHEAVCTLLALDEAAVECVCMAPDVPFEVVDHRTGQSTGERRNVLTESARIARGNIQDIKEVDADELDALILPGGFGAAKNLSSFAVDGPKMTVLPEVESLIHAVHKAGKPIGAICIAPAVISRLIPGVSLTIGNDPDTAGALTQMGSTHCDCPVTDFVVDREKKVVSTPAYMLGPWVADVNQGIARCVREVLGMLE
jgi:enhancing lycopene biosynthesis protein 2